MWKNKITAGRFLFALWVAGGIFAPAGLHGQQQFQGWCARVKIEILQEMTLERIGFEATLEVSNNDGADPITDFLAELTFEDPELSTADEPNDASDLFFVRAPTLQSVNAVDGNGVIGPTKTAVVRWFIIPKISAGGTDPRGKVYRVGARLGGRLAGVEIPEENMTVIPADITVRPEPQLEITYFQPRDVQGDDPFTEQVESPIPFTLGVLVKNSGYGIARQVKIDSQQPRIVENKQGLLLVARLLGARVMDSPLNRASLLVDLGDIQPGETRKGAWDMITSLSGEFIDFRASYTHASDLGGMETSVIKSLEAHFIVREVMNDQPGRDGILDFLAVTDRNANLIPDAMFESQGNVVPVNHLKQVELLGGIDSERKIRVRLQADFEGWGYMRLNDPGQARLGIKRVVRSDGKVLHPRNVWTNIRYQPITNLKLTWLNIFDQVQDGRVYHYEIEYAPAAVDTEPPVTEILFAGDQSVIDGKYFITRDTDILFISEDESPVSIFYRIGDGAFQPALPFRIAEPGEYLISYYAEDTAGNREENRTATVVITGSAPLFSQFEREDGGLLLSGETISARQDRFDFSFDVAPNPLGVHAELDIFRGVVAWPSLSGIPPSPTPRTTAAVQVTGDYVDYYRYRVNGEEWSGEFPATEPIHLSGLSGDISLEVLARSRHGNYLPAAAAVEARWQIAASATAWTVTGLPPTPARSDAVILQMAAPGMTHYRWRLDNSHFRPETPVSQPLSLVALDPGDRVISVFGKSSTTWQTESSAVSIRWRIDPAWGSDLSSLVRVLSRTYPEVAGQRVSVSWDGRDDSGKAQPAGWYTVRVTIVDTLGRSAFATRLVRVEDVSGERMALADSTRAARKPHARGDWVVWQERFGGVWNIAARNLADPYGETLQVTSSTLSQENPYTDGRYVVWQARQPNGTWDILMRDLQSGSGAQVITATPDRNEVRPVVDWPWIVYQTRPIADANAPWQLFARNLATGLSEFISPSSQDQQAADIHAGRVVWQDHRDVGPGEIYFLDLETRASVRLTHNVWGQYNPRIYGDWIVWQDTRNQQVEIYGYHLQQGKEVRLTQTAENETEPFLYDRWLVMAEDSGGALFGNLRLMHMDNGRVVPLTNTLTAKSRPVLAGDRVIWEERLPEGDEIQSSHVPALQPVFENNNAVVVTSALAARFGNAFALLSSWNSQAGVTAVSRYSSLVPAVTLQEAVWAAGGAGGENFALIPGEFLWVRFGEARVLDLGPRSAVELTLTEGIHALTSTRFPPGYHAFRLIDEIGSENVRAIRMLDPISGFWRTVEVRGQGILGTSFPIPNVAVLFLDLVNPVTEWTPGTHARRDDPETP
jgi:beta propeller repeat protein